MHFKATPRVATTSAKQKHRLTNWPAYEAGLRQRETYQSKET
jgi:hypothetical protein